MMCLTFILIVVFHSTVAFVNNANRINIGHNMMINNKNNSSFGWEWYNGDISWSDGNEDIYYKYSDDDVFVDNLHEKTNDERVVKGIHVVEDNINYTLCREEINNTVSFNINGTIKKGPFEPLFKSLLDTYSDVGYISDGVPNFAIVLFVFISYIKNVTTLSNYNRIAAQIIAITISIVLKNPKSLS